MGALQKPRIHLHVNHGCRSPDIPNT
jgi:hypothetical protein